MERILEREVREMRKKDYERIARLLTIVYRNTGLQGNAKTLCNLAVVEELRKENNFNYEKFIGYLAKTESEE